MYWLCFCFCYSVMFFLYVSFLFESHNNAVVIMLTCWHSGHVFESLQWWTFLQNSLGPLGQRSQKRTPYNVLKSAQHDIDYIGHRVPTRLLKYRAGTTYPICSARWERLRETARFTSQGQKILQVSLVFTDIMYLPNPMDRA